MSGSNYSSSRSGSGSMGDFTYSVPSGLGESSSGSVTTGSISTSIPGTAVATTSSPTGVVQQQQAYSEGLQLDAGSRSGSNASASFLERSLVGGSGPVLHADYTSPGHQQQPVRSFSGTAFGPQHSQDTRISASYPQSQHASYQPPRSSGGLPTAAGLQPPGSSHGPSISTNLWGYNVPSPPNTATQSTVEPSLQHPGSAVATGPAYSNASGAGATPQKHLNYPLSAGGIPIPSLNGNQALYHGYNVSNTRPMTAPGSSISAPGYYHASAYGMFSPETYTGAGFPQSFPRHPGTGYPGEMYNPPGSSGGPPGSANAAADRANGMPAGRDRMYTLHQSGLPDEPSSSHRLSMGPGTGSMGDIFAHQPPPLSGGAGQPPPFGYHHSHQQQYRPGTDYGHRRPLEDFEESRYSRPGTSETARPDTAYSNLSYNSGYSALYQHLTHPSLYHTGQGGMAGFERGHTYNFVPLPSQPKKRPRRRFEEIERLYNCSYPGCNKSYGTLNHLNAHVSMQKHGPKRLPAEFKEIRKAWRQRKKEAEAAARASGDKDDSPNKNGDGGSDKDDFDEDEPEENDVPHPSSGHPQSHSHPHLHSHSHAPKLPAYAPGAPDPRPGFPPQFSAGHPPVSLQAPPGYLSNMHCYYAQSNMSPNSSGAGGYMSRPSTAPSHLMHLPSFTSVGHPNGLMGVSPLVGGIPPGYLGVRKNSLTSLPPAFPSIQEESNEESGHGAVNGSHDNGSKPGVQSGGTSPHLPTPPILLGGPMSTTSLTGLGVHAHDSYSHSSQPQQQQHQNGSVPINSHAMQNGEGRPSTASSPFRFTASGLGEIDHLEKNNAPNHLATPASMGGGQNASSTVDVGTRWSPDWKSLTQASSYPQEVSR